MSPPPCSGSASAAILTLLPIAWADYFGRANFGAIRGVALSAQVVAQAAGPLLSGALHDWTGSYALAPMLRRALRAQHGGGPDGAPAEISAISG